MKKNDLHRLIGVIGFLILIILIFQFSGLRDSFNLTYLRSTLNNNIIIGLLLFSALFSLGNLIQIPGWIFLAAAVLTLGKFYGGLATYFAAVFSCITTYGLIKFIGQDALRGLESGVAKNLLNRLDRHPVSSVIGLRVIFQTVPVLNYTLALSGLKFRHYLAGTLLGLPVPIFFYCLFFDFLATQVFAI